MNDIEKFKESCQNLAVIGDSLEEMKKIPDNSIDLIFADPPYWMRVEGSLYRPSGKEFDGCNDKWDQFSELGDYEEFTEKWLSECRRILSPKGSFWVIGGMQCIYTIGAIMQKLGFWFINDIIWHKKNPTPNFMGTRANNAHETLIWAVKDKNSKYTFNYKTGKELNTDTVSPEEYKKGIRKQLGSVWKIAVCQGTERLKDENGEKLHSTQKPEELLYRIIAISSKIGDLVFDPFGGTMTTAAMAKRMGRNYLTIEKDKKYFAFGCERIKNTVPNIGDIEKAVFDIKAPRVTMNEMIDANYFTEGEKFYFKNTDKFIILKRDNKVLLGDTVTNMHEAAAVVGNRKAQRVNGFDYWYVIRNNQFISIDTVRNNYIREMLNK